jgi:hypothetical protein
MGQNVRQTNSLYEMVYKFPARRNLSLGQLVTTILRGFPASAPDVGKIPSELDSDAPWVEAVRSIQVRRNGV